MAATPAPRLQMTTSIFTTFASSSRETTIYGSWTVEGEVLSTVVSSRQTKMYSVRKPLTWVYAASLSVNQRLEAAIFASVSSRSPSHWIRHSRIMKNTLERSATDHFIHICSSMLHLVPVRATRQQKTRQGATLGTRSPSRNSYSAELPALKTRA